MEYFYAVQLAIAFRDVKKTTRKKLLTVRLEKKNPKTHHLYEYEIYPSNNSLHK
jgi:hypothetical protein